MSKPRLALAITDLADNGKDEQLRKISFGFRWLFIVINYSRKGKKAQSWCFLKTASSQMNCKIPSLEGSFKNGEFDTKKKKKKSLHRYMPDYLHSNSIKGT